MPSLTKRNRFVMLLFLNMFNAVYMIYWYVSVLKELSFFRGKKFSGACGSYNYMYGFSGALLLRL